MKVPKSGLIHKKENKSDGEDKSQSGCAAVAVGIFWLLVLIVAIRSCPSQEEKAYVEKWERFGRDKQDAVAAAERFVEKSLKSPSTAAFPTSGQRGIDLGNGEWEISSYVDAQNSFGATLRKSWTAVVVKRSDGWSLKSLSIDD